MAKILVVEQHQSLGELYRLILKQFAHEVTVVTSWKLGLALTQKHSFQLIILDLATPDHRALAQLQASGIPERIPVILTTSLGESEIRDLIAPIKFAAALFKPFSVGDLLIVIQHLLPTTDQE